MFECTPLGIAFCILGISFSNTKGDSSIMLENFENGASSWRFLKQKNTYTSLDGPIVVEDPARINGRVLALNSCTPLVAMNLTDDEDVPKYAVSFEGLGNAWQGFTNDKIITWMVRDKEYAGSLYHTSPPYDQWQLIEYVVSNKVNGLFSSIFFGASPSLVGGCSLAYVDNIKVEKMIPERKISVENTGNFPSTAVVAGASLLVALGIFLLYQKKIASQRTSIFSRRRTYVERSLIDFDKLFKAGNWIKNVKVLKFDEFKRIEQLGEGNSSEVWAYQWHGTTVAGKSLKTPIRFHLEGKVPHSEGKTVTYLPSSSAEFVSSRDGDKELDKFRWEVFALTTIGSDEHVVALNGIVNDPELVVLFHMPSKSVYDYMTVNNVILEDKLRIALSVASGLIHLHYERLIHRDIALRNILLGRLVNGRIDEVVIGDFEISRFLKPSETVSKCDSNYGPIALMAPEAFKCLYSAHTDVYMYGMFLYSLFGHTVPWRNYVDNDQVGTLVTKVIRGDRPKLLWDEDMYPAFTNIVKTCWKSDPVERGQIVDIKDRLRVLQVNELPPTPNQPFIGGQSSYSSCDV